MTPVKWRFPSATISTKAWRVLQAHFSTLKSDWARYDQGRYLLNYCSALVPRFLDEAVQLIVLKFPGISRQEIVGPIVWSDKHDAWLHHEGWDFELLNDYYGKAKDMIEAERKAYEGAKRRG